MKVISPFVFVLFTFANQAMGEYRVYQYLVRNKITSPFDNQSYVISSTLDPVSFLSYNGGRESIEADLLNSWMCKGHTGKKDLCPSPLQTSEKKLETESDETASLK